MRRMGASLFAEWRAFYALDPFGEERADLRMGVLASVLSNLFRGKRGRRKAPADFMLGKYFEEALEGPEELEARLLAKVKFANWALGGRVVRKKRNGID